ncbi:MAG: Imidazole glycerol phosphate synthase subunit HisH [Candidatus Omnitrophica bacterium]|nr:Imidazole glycerol phosphate synthase subunit HisH [Candidatus Omnitrophota bacterium]
MSAQVVIVDYGVGNLFNVRRALALLGYDAVISRDPAEVARAPRVLLPGVGAFEAGMDHLRRYGLSEAVKDAARSGRPVLGICLGMQLLLSESEENGTHRGLDLVPGRVRRFTTPSPEGPVYKIPQIGWNALEHTASSRDWSGTVLDGLPERSFMYFVHSYRVVPADPGVVLASTRYGQDEFCSVLKRDNISGCQFHPERSGEYGLKILENFVTGKS